MKISIAEIREKLKAALTKRGVPEKMAIIIAEEYLEGELEGKQSHGLMAFPSQLKSTENFQDRNYKVITKTNSLMVVDANGLSGSYVGRVIVDELVKIASIEGAALGFIKNMTTWLRPGAIAQQVADQNMVAFVINNGGKPMIAPPGGYDPVVGTNPIGIGIPTKSNAVLVDMATSKRAWGEVRKAKKNGTELPKESYYTNTGNFAVNPDDAHSALPMGDYKGFSLALFIEIMTGSFLGRIMGDQNPSGGSVQDSHGHSITRGAMILVMNPKMTTDLDQFKNANSELLQTIKSVHKLPGVEEIHIPGEQALETRNRNLKNGYLDIDENLWQTINS